MENNKPNKPLGYKAYGSIPHLPGSRRGPADKGLTDHQASILTCKTRDKHDVIIVQEKLDGSCVAVVKMGGDIVPLIRAGYLASGSNYPQHHAFHSWVMANKTRFYELLQEGERVCGEWLMEAHGTKYTLTHEPFVPFDLMIGNVRAIALDVRMRCNALGFTTPNIISYGPPMSTEAALVELGNGKHGAEDPEGAVWRCERKGVVDFLGKYVKPDKVDGKYFPHKTGLPTVYNWIP